MDKETDFVLDRLLDQTAESALATLTAGIDIEQRLRDLYREAEEAP
ncbi:hypothetical protein [Actinoallomurus iriomotensis]|jgi:hypothetical protein|uniref:Uncharacterized protein n=1 Tax=Actinoallomurus iriomotensis TaxID=478107 RepID=A0A9W6RTU9_9ACTN|nr:hypothetical protein [Actinoallomurus iriomotensis]GLY80067.1 hypothetical protein Airi01_083340 [Actinoallomurus iriomotensis]